MAKIVIAGGSGFMGGILAAHFIGKGDEVVILTRKINNQSGNPLMVQWDGKHIGDWVTHLEGCNVLINLTGKSVNCRYNNKNKAEILNSRLDATRVLGEALGNMASPPELWINAASATIYRHAEDHPQDEYTGELGAGFSVDVCKQWENAFFEQATLGVRKIGLRIAIVLGKNGGVLPYFKNLARFGLGGKQGSGKQYFSWIHEYDLISIIDFLISHKQFSGVFNVSSPNPVPNSYLMQTFRNAVSMPVGLPATKWMLEIGTFILRTETELILKSRWVVPTRLLNEGYKFKVHDIRNAINLLCSR